MNQDFPFLRPVTLLTALALVGTAAAEAEDGAAAPAAADPAPVAAPTGAAPPTEAAAPAPAAALAVPAPAAPSAPAAAPPYPLSQALVDAQQLNDTTEIATARLDAALAARRQAVALLLPSLTANGELGTTDTSHRPWGGPALRYGGYGATVNLSLFNAAAYPGLQVATLGASTQALLSADLRRQLAFQVVTSYLGVISAEQNQEAARQILGVTNESLRETQARAKVGLNSLNDATRAELDVANANLALTNDHQAVLAARLSLGDLVGHTVDAPLADPAPASLPPGSIANLEALARSSRPDLLANVLEIRLEDELIQANKNLYAPSVGLIGSYENFGYQPATPPGSPYPQWTAALSATWTLYDGGMREGEIEAAEAERRQAQAVEHAARQDLHRDLATAIANLSTQDEVVRQAQVSLKVAQVNDQEVTTRYSQGLATQLDVSDAHSALFSAQVALIAANISSASARYQLRLLVGWWPLRSDDPAPLSMHGPHPRPAADAAASRNGQ